MFYIIIFLVILIANSDWLYNQWQSIVRGRRSKASFFSHSYINEKAFYVYLFNRVPNVQYLGNLKAGKAFELITGKYKSKLVSVFQDNTYNYEEKQMQFDTTLFEMQNHVLLELGNSYINVLYSRQYPDWLKMLVNELSELKAEPKQREHEINIIVNTRDGLELRNLPIQPTTLEIDKFYNDDFQPVHNTILERLKRDNDKGIVLLHGLPGTGKTTYLRHLIGSIDKRVLFVSPTVAENLMGPMFLDLLMEYPNSVLVIEDAENIIMDRNVNNSSGVSNLLNLSDGLLSDCLSVQIICTFNSNLSLIDSALMRKGRLIAEYKFDKLHVNKARELAAHLGYTYDVRRPMTLAEITNADAADFEKPQQNAIGFKNWALDEVEAQ